MSEAVEMISVPRIHLGAETQMRALLDTATIDEYAAAMKGGAEFPPIMAFVEGAGTTKCYWIGDGHHRSHAAHSAGLAKIAAIVRAGTVRDAILYAASANGSHGLRRTNADKRRAVTTLLKDNEWRAKSDHWIAERCGVSQPYVGSVRADTIEAQAKAVITCGPETRAGRDGKTYPVPSKHETTNTDRQYDAMKSTPAKVTTRKTITETEKVDTATGEIVDEANEPEYKPADEEGDKLRAEIEADLTCLEERKAGGCWLASEREWAGAIAARFAALGR